MIKRVLFSVLMPHEGYIDVEASSDEEAIEIVSKMMKDNYKNFTVGKVYNLEDDPKILDDVPYKVLN